MDHAPRVDPAAPLAGPRSGGGFPATGVPHTVDVLSAGVGPAAAAAGTAAALTAAALAGQPYGLVVSAGIGGGFPDTAPLGSVVVADAVVAADLGARTPDGFVPVDRLGFGRSVHLPPPDTARRIAEALAGAGLAVALAPVLTVSTVTGSAVRAAELAARHSGAGAEAMEGFGVAEAAAVHGLPVLEIRAVSNPVGPRDRAAWRIPEALSALTDTFEVLTTEPGRTAVTRAASARADNSGSGTEAAAPRPAGGGAGPRGRAGHTSAAPAAPAARVHRTDRPQQGRSRP
ncbi:futalosine hydrolase [Streptomyces sp. F63]|uniref:futalosine hydrolase n=1 Tax=Streptomyces sp. F63 TaxID=2824887 RepID=UPI0024950090|nr:futalosine hydrolase [Streptomyces sp. F63]